MPTLSLASALLVYATTVITRKHKMMIILAACTAPMCLTAGGQLR
jgi:hypothetical protein